MGSGVPRPRRLLADRLPSSPHRPRGPVCQARASSAPQGHVREQASHQAYHGRTTPQSSALSPGECRPGAAARIPNSGEPERTCGRAPERAFCVPRLPGLLTPGRRRELNAGPPVQRTVTQSFKKIITAGSAGQSAWDGLRQRTAAHGRRPRGKVEGADTAAGVYALGPSLQTP